MQKLLKPIAIFLLFISFLASQLFAEDSWNFAVLGDSRPSYYNAPYPQVFSRMISELNLIYPDCIFYTGDSILAPDDGEKTRTAFNQFLSLTQKLLPPLYITPGNHDYDSPTTIKLYHELISPKPYYSLDYKNCHFIMLNTEIPGQEKAISGEQLAWLKNDL